MFRTALCLAVALCFVPLAGAASIDANTAGCNGGGSGSCSSGPYLMSYGGEGYASFTFDYSVPNSQVKQISYLDDLKVGVEVWNYPTKNDSTLKSFDIYLLVGSQDHTTATYSLLLGTVGPTSLAGYNGSNRDPITATLTNSSSLAAFLTALKGSKGDFEVEIVPIAAGGGGAAFSAEADGSFSFNLGQRQKDDNENAVRFATLDAETPEPASLGMAGFGLLALCWSLRKKIAR